MISDPNYRVITCRDNEGIVRAASGRIGGEWPEFMLHDPVADNLTYCYDHLPDFQFVLISHKDEKVVAIGNSIPLAWADDIHNLPDDGWDWALLNGVETHRGGRRPDFLCALQIVVFGEFRGRGISKLAVEAMRGIGRSQGLAAMIAPVRPSRKHEFPQVPISEYITWTGDDGRPFDPWLRVHADFGARIIRPCPTAMRITGTVAEWERWTAMQFPRSGEYIIPGALVPISIDCQSDRGEYIEPNVWMHHPG